MPDYAAIDLGAESGRVVVGRLRNGRMTLEEVHRFPNRPVRLPDGLRWNLLALFTETLDGLRAAARGTRLRGVGVDAWGVDYALLDERDRVLGLPFHYRDQRTEGMVPRAFERVPAAELYEATGIQTMPINTVFQLLADEGTPALDSAARVAMVPDLISLWLCGVAANEATAASTTGLLDARRGTWASPIIERLGLPARLFGALIEPGTRLGPILDHHAQALDLPLGLAVHAVAGHDTASAFAAAPVRDEHSAILSSGTWSLLGLELSEPVLDERARAYNLTNERGVDATIRLLRNVMGLWLVQECRRAWAVGGQDVGYDDLHRVAAAVTGDVALFDPDQEAFLRPTDMPARVARACRDSGQVAPREPGAVVRSILTSLACKYRLVLEQLERASGRDVRTIHVIGGGARNELLCRLTADMTGRTVLAGPVEATAMGNVLMQARSDGQLASAADMRAVANASVQATTHEPSPDRGEAQATYERFLAVTGLSVDASAPTAS